MKSRQEGKQRTQEQEGVTWCAVGMILEIHTESLKHLEPMHVHWMNGANEKNVRMRAYGEVLSVHTRRVHDMSGREKKKPKTS